MRLFDTHAHLDDERFTADLSEVLARAESVGVEQVTVVATTAASCAECVRLAETHSLLLAAVGLHPNHLTEEGPTAWDEVVRWVRHPRVVAVGETGLDRYWDRTPLPLQEEFFARHLHLARDENLPVVIHCREAEADVVRMLREVYDRHGPIRGVLHSFTGSATTAEAALVMGLHISFAGMLTYKNAEALRSLAGTIPADRLLIETDSPYLAPVPVRGRRNEPAFVAHTLTCLAAVRGVAPFTLAEQTTQNARSLFRRLSLA